MHNAILHIGFGFYLNTLNYESALSSKDQVFITHLKSGGSWVGWGGYKGFKERE